MLDLILSPVISGEVWQILHLHYILSMSKRLKSVIAIFVFEQLDLIFLRVSAIHARFTIYKDYVMICLFIPYKTSLYKMPMELDSTTTSRHDSLICNFGISESWKVSQAQKKIIITQKLFSWLYTWNKICSDLKFHNTILNLKDCSPFTQRLTIRNLTVSNFKLTCC